MDRKILIVTGLLITSFAFAQTTVSTSDFNRSEDAEGVRFELDSSLPAWSGSPKWSLDSFTFESDGLNSGAGAHFLNVYEGTTGGTFMGASTNSIDLGPTVNGADLDFTFSGITFDTDQAYSIVFSATNAAGNIAPVGLKSQEDRAIYVNGFVNLVDGKVFDVGGSEPGEYITFNGSFTVIPEPSSYAFFSVLLALSCIALRRRARG